MILVFLLEFYYFNLMINNLFIFQEDVNSHWVVKGVNEKEVCSRGEPIECGEKIRLEHLTTKKNLHSHHFSSPLSSDQVRSFNSGI